MDIEKIRKAILNACVFVPADIEEQLMQAEKSLALLSAQTEAREGDAERLNWLANGGWEVMQDPDMWPPNLNFRETIDHGRVVVSLDAIGNAQATETR